MIPVILTLVFLWLVFELVTLFCQKLWNTIHGNGIILLEKELSSSRLNSLDRSIIGLNGVSELNARYVTTTATSIVFPYYLLDYNGMEYGILLFSKAYFIVRKKHKELKNNAARKKHLRFS